MNILHVVNTLSPRATGLPKAVCSIASAQAGAGHTVSILHQGGGPAAGDARGEYGGFPGFSRVTFLTASSFTGGLRLLSPLEKPDAVHVHGLWEPLLHGALVWAQQHGIRTVVTPHGMSSPWQDRRYRAVKFFLRRVAGYGKRWRRANRIHTLSEQEAAHWRSQGYDRVEVVPNGVFPGEMERSGGFPRWEGPPEGTPYILFLGRLAAQKAPERVLEVFLELAERFPDTHLVFAGPDFGQGRLLGERVRRARLGHRVWFPGALDTPTKWAALRGARLLAQPSRNEGHSLTVLEAAAVGCPMWLSPESAFPELVEAGGAEIREGSLKECSDTLGNLLEQDSRREAMGARARELVRERYTWERLLPDLMSLYGEAHAPGA